VAEFAAENIYRPLGMHQTGYLPRQELRSRTATTEQRDGTWLRGEVHDPRAALLGGVAGHAGLFSTAADLALYARMILSAGRVGDRLLLNPLTIAEMSRPRNVDGNQRALGWDSLSKYSTNRGELFSSRAIGHGGFTGTAMWIDPQLDLFVIFLANRLHPDGQGNVNPLAGRIGTVAAAAIRNPAPPVNRVMSAPDTTENKPVLLGIDVLSREGFKSLQGRRVGLITNHTGLDSRGQRTIDLLHQAPQVELVAIFSPEHGLQGQLDVSEIADARDEATGLPVYSLYGKSRRPQGEQLAGIDTLVFDIQDIGTRFYTYISTMGEALEAAAEHDLQFVVLDRPNPIGGTIVEGPVLQPGLESFVGYHTLPVRHGMTVGELAQLICREKQFAAKLRIVRVENWRRDQSWDQTGLVWTNPSPNMRSLTQALLYPGIGLLETTNLSVGRGTDTPFEVVGAPWIDGRELAGHLDRLELPGVTFVPIRFTPMASKYADEPCEGVNIVLVNRQEFRSVPVGLAIALTLRELYPDQWELERFNRLLCNEQVFSAVEQCSSLDEIEALAAPQLDEFLKRRSEFLIYP
jgi:uncharacterized protein YbbC (DUF1343 family)